MYKIYPKVKEAIRFSFDKYPGYSVEANYEGNSATNNGVDFGGYPISRTFTFGLNFNF